MENVDWNMKICTWALTKLLIAQWYFEDRNVTLGFNTLLYTYIIALCTIALLGPLSRNPVIIYFTLTAEEQLKKSTYNIGNKKKLILNFWKTKFLIPLTNNDMELIIFCAQSVKILCNILKSLCEQFYNINLLVFVQNQMQLLPTSMDLWHSCSWQTWSCFCIQLLGLSQWEEIQQSSAEQEVLQVLLSTKTGRGEEQTVSVFSVCRLHEISIHEISLLWTIFCFEHKQTSNHLLRLVTTFFRCVCKIEKETISFVMSQCICMEQFVSHWTDFHKNRYSYFSKICDENASLIKIWQE